MRYVICMFGDESGGCVVSVCVCECMCVWVCLCVCVCVCVCCSVAILAQGNISVRTDSLSVVGTTFVGRIRAHCTSPPSPSRGPGVCVFCGNVLDSRPAQAPQVRAVQHQWVGMAAQEGKIE